MTTTTIKIGRSTYTATGSEQRRNTSGQMQTLTDLRGGRGANVTMIETDGVDIVTLIHFGRTKPAQYVHRDDITRS